MHIYDLNEIKSHFYEPLNACYYSEWHDIAKSRDYSTIFPTNWTLNVKYDIRNDLFMAPICIKLHTQSFELSTASAATLKGLTGEGVVNKGSNWLDKDT